MTSEIRANTLKNRVGLGTVSFTNTGIVVSGIVTANSFSGSNLNLSGVTTTTDHIHIKADNKQLRIGAHNDGDMLSYHDGNKSVIVNYTGDFHIRSNNGSRSSNEGIVLKPNGATEIYHSGNKKLETASTGANVIGNLDVINGHVYINDNYKAYFGTNNDLEIFHNDDDAYIRNNKGALILRNNGQTGDADASQIYIQATPAENSIQCSPNGAVILYHNNVPQLVTTTAGVSLYRDLDVDGHTNLDNLSIAGISTFSGNVNITNTNPKLFFYDTNNDSDFAIVNNGGVFRINDETNSLNRFSIDSNGNVSILKDLDVDGHTNLDNVSIAGVTTFSDRAYLTHDLTITGTAPRVIFTDTNNNSDYRINVDAGYFQIQDITNSYANRFNIASNGAVSINHAGTGDNTLHIGCTSNAGGIIIKAPGDHYANMVIDSNRSGANNGIFNLAGRWNGNDVAYMSFTTGTDTTNKDDGYIRFYTRLSGSSLTERLKIQSNGDVYLNPTVGSTSVNSGAIRRFNAGLDYWSGTLGSANSIKYAVHGAGDDNMYGFGISSSLLELQSQVDIGFFAGGAGSGTGRRVEQARLKSTGRFGLGVSDPDQKLHISAPSGDVYFQTDTTVNGGLLIYVQGTQRGVFANDSAFSGTTTDIGIGAKGNMNFRTGTSSYTQRLRIDTEGVTALGPFASYAYSNLTSLFNIHNGARVNTGGANQFAAPKGGFCDSARYELEASLISYSTSAQQTIQAQNGAQLKIGNSRSNWSYYNNLPNYLLGHAATDCINTSNYTLTLKATMTVFLQRSNSWNAVPLSGWELLESNTNIYPGSTDSRLYVKTLAAGSYSGWDSDSAMYFFVL